MIILDTNGPDGGDLQAANSLGSSSKFMSYLFLIKELNKEFEVELIKSVEYDNLGQCTLTLKGIILPYHLLL